MRITMKSSCFWWELFSKYLNLIAWPDPISGVRSRAEAFAVKDGKFIAVGTNEDMKAVTGKNTKVVNLKGKMVRKNWGGGGLMLSF